MIKRTNPHYRQVQKDVFLKPLLSNNTSVLGSLSNNLPYLDLRIDIASWIRQMTAAIICAATKSKHEVDWEKAVVFAPDHLNIGKPGPYTLIEVYSWAVAANNLRDLLNNSLDWRLGFYPQNQTYPPDIFQFYICISGDQVFVRMKFLSQFTWFVIFNAPDETLSKIKNTLDHMTELKRIK